MGPDAAHEDIFGRIPPQGGPQDDGEATMKRTGRMMGLPPSGGCDGRGGLAGDGELHLPTPEHSCKVYCDQDNYGPVSSGKTEAGAKDGSEMVGKGRVVFGGDTDSGPGGGTDRGIRGDGRDGD